MNGIIGALVGDIVGSRFEWHNHKSKDFDLFAKNCFPTDDSIMTLAIMSALIEADGDKNALGELAKIKMRYFGNKYPNAGYGGRFREWLKNTTMGPYGSYGNGAAMRVSGVIYVGKSLDEVIKLSRIVTEVTHNHKEGIKGAEATAVAGYLALQNESKDFIRKYINERYYTLDFTINEIRDSYMFDETCQGTVPQAIEAFLESTDFEDAIRNAISVGGDSDTLAAITGAIAGAFYGVPNEIVDKTINYLADDLKDVYEEYNKRTNESLKI